MFCIVDHCSSHCFFPLLLHLQKTFNVMKIIFRRMHGMSYKNSLFSYNPSIYRNVQTAVFFPQKAKAVPNMIFVVFYVASFVWTSPRFPVDPTFSTKVRIFGGILFRRNGRNCSPLKHKYYMTDLIRNITWGFRVAQSLFSFISGYIGVSTSFYKKSMSGCAQFTNGQCTVNKKNKKRKIIYYICVKL
jgi:hypothetical protein